MGRAVQGLPRAVNWTVYTKRKAVPLYKDVRMRANSQRWGCGSGDACQTEQERERKELRLRLFVRLRQGSGWEHTRAPGQNA